MKTSNLAALVCVVLCAGRSVAEPPRSPAELTVSNGEKAAAARLILAGADVTRDDRGRVDQVAFCDKEATEADLAFLAALPHLERLKVAGKQFTDAGFAHLAKLAALKSLEVRNAPLTNDGLKHLAALQNLESLFLENTAITDAGLVELAALKRLRVLFCAGDLLPESDELTKLRRSLPNLTAKVETSEVLVARLVRLGATLVPANIEARAAYFRGKVSREALIALRGLQELNYLDLAKCEFDNDDLAQLKYLRRLEVLNLYGTKTTDAGLAHLLEAASLKSVKLVRTDVTLAGLLTLVEHRGLTDVSIAETDIDRVAIAALQTKQPYLRINVLRSPYILSDPSSRFPPWEYPRTHSPAQDRPNPNLPKIDDLHFEIEPIRDGEQLLPKQPVQFKYHLLEIPTLERIPEAVP